MLEATPGAPLPADDSAGSLGAAFLGQTGQLQKANTDKSTAMTLGDSCEAEWQKAIQDAKPKKFLGIF